MIDYDLKYRLRTFGIGRWMSRCVPIGRSDRVEIVIEQCRIYDTRPGRQRCPLQEKRIDSHKRNKVLLSVRRYNTGSRSTCRYNTTDRSREPITSACWDAKLETNTLELSYPDRSPPDYLELDTSEVRQQSRRVIYLIVTICYLFTVYWNFLRPKIFVKTTISAAMSTAM